MEKKSIFFHKKYFLLVLSNLTWRVAIKSLLHKDPRGRGEATFVIPMDLSFEHIFWSTKRGSNSSWLLQCGKSNSVFLSRGFAFMTYWSTQVASRNIWGIQIWHQTIRARGRIKAEILPLTFRLARSENISHFAFDKEELQGWISTGLEASLLSPFRGAAFFLTSC